MGNDEETRLNYEQGSEWHIKKSLNYNAEAFIDLFVKNLKGKRILEIGVGAGRDIKHFLYRGIIVDGIDYSKNFIAHCKKQFPDLNFMHGDIRNIDLPEGYYDGIWAFASLLNMPKKDLKKVLSKLKSCLKENGMLLISVKEGEGEKMVSDVAGRRLFSFYKMDELKAIIEKSGFRVIFSDLVTDCNLTESNKEKQKPNWIVVLSEKE